MEPISIIFLFIILILSVILGCIMFYYIRLQKKYVIQETIINKHYLQRAKTEASEIVEEAGQEALSMLNAAQTVSAKDQAILEAVVKQIVSNQSAYLKSSADKLLQEFNTSLSQIKEANIQAISTSSKQINTASSNQTVEYNKLLEQVKLTSTQLIQQFEAQLQQLKNYNINTLTNVSKDIERDTKNQVDSYTKKLEEETIDSEKQVSQKVNEEYKLVQKDIAAYKQAQLKKIDESLQGLVKKMATEILEKSISPNEHNDIIMQTLEKAKTDNLFVN